MRWRRTPAGRRMRSNGRRNRRPLPRLQEAAAPVDDAVPDPDGQGSEASALSTDSASVPSSSPAVGVGTASRRAKGQAAPTAPTSSVTVSSATEENLCLYGCPNETWEVTLQAEEVPPDIPEPALGINFAIDGMNEKDWLALVAVHTDCWLHCV